MTEKLIQVNEQKPAASLQIASENSTQIRSAIAGKAKALFNGKCQRVLIINPMPFEPELFSMAQARARRYYAWPAYGPAILVKTLKNRGIDAGLLDLNYEILEFALKDPAADPKEIEERIHTLWKEIVKAKVESFKPDVVAMSCMFTMTHAMMVNISEYIKSFAPGIPVIAGGVHVSNAPEYVLRSSKSIDFVGTNESDVSFPNFIEFIRGNVEEEQLTQIASLINDEYVALKDKTAPSAEELDIMPDYDGYAIDKFFWHGEIGTYRCWLPEGSRASSVLSNRGCRAHCTFCSVANFNGKGVRQRSVKSVLDEIQYLKDTYGITHIAWLDDDLFFNKQRAIDLFNGIIERKLGITWCASNGVIASATSSSPELLKAVVDSGCIGMTFGVESGNDEILRSVSKPSGVKHFIKVGDMMKSYPQVFTRGFLIIGFPNEALSQIKDTISLANKMELDWYGIQLLSPLPNTEIYKTMVQLGIINDKEFEKNTDKDGSRLFVMRQGEKQRSKEEKEKEQASNFVNLIDIGDDSHIPTREELHELWLVVDYLINYKPILEMTDVSRLRKKQAILRDICDRFTRGNPMANLFLMIVEERLGCTNEAALRKQLTEEFLASSAYWRTRFQAFDLYKWLGHGFETIIIQDESEGSSSLTSEDMRKSGGYVV